MERIPFVDLESLLLSSDLAVGRGRGVRKTRPRCDECGKEFSNQSALSKHRLTHSDERRFVCSLCSKAFKRQDHLNGHLLTHRDKKPFECDVDGCDKTYCDARSLRRHKENHHHQFIGGPSSLQPYASASSTSGVAEKGDLLSELLSVECSVCRKQFKTVNALNGHMRLHGGFQGKSQFDSLFSKHSSHSLPTTPVVQTASAHYSLPNTPTQHPVTFSFSPDQIQQYQQETSQPEATAPVFAFHQLELDDELTSFMESIQKDAHLFDFGSSSEPHSVDLDLSLPPPSSLAAPSEQMFPDEIGLMAAEEEEEPKQPEDDDDEKKRSKHRPEPLYIPPSVNTFRIPKLWEPSSSKQLTPPPYTPPPMLSPVRTQSGLYWTVISAPPTTPPIAAIERQLSSPVEEEEEEEEDEEVLPHVNVGAAYQAVLPEFHEARDDELFNTDEHADQVWDPSVLRPDIEPEFNLLLELSCSACIPGAGRNTELTHHLLYELNGDIQAAILFLLKPERGLRLSTFKFSETSVWSSEEIGAYQEALLHSDKDFFAIAKQVGSKSIKECVEFYYLWKKVCPDEYRKWRIVRRKKEEEGVCFTLRKNSVAAETSPPPSLVFACRICGKSFPKVKSRSAHMKIHGATAKH